jgi:hypothetical protein
VLLRFLKITEEVKYTAKISKFINNRSSSNLTLLVAPTLAEDFWVARELAKGDLPLSFSAEMENMVFPVCTAIASIVPSQFPRRSYKASGHWGQGIFARTERRGSCGRERTIVLSDDADTPGV